VAKINFGADKTLQKELENLSQHQLSDPTLTKIHEQLEKNPSVYMGKYMSRDHVLFHRYNKAQSYWRAIVPRNLQYWVIELYIHYQGTDKCIQQIFQSLHLKNLGRKVRRYIAHCDICQHVQHPNLAFEIISQSHVPTSQENC
jgi:hypothetical protein